MTVSSQGAELYDEDALRAAAQELAAAGPDVLARPATWGAWRLVPDRVEFWHGRRDRLHRRLAYTRDGTGWSARRLQP